MRLDLLRQLVAEIERPAAGETRGAAAGVRLPAGRDALWSEPLGPPPLLECGEKAAAARAQAFSLQAAVRGEPQRRARQAEKQARSPQGAGGGAVEQQRIAPRVARRQALQRRRRDVEFAKERCVRSRRRFRK
jgi:hypothetical protein